jgi:hypothetical protein
MALQRAVAGHAAVMVLSKGVTVSGRREGKDKASGVWFLAAAWLFMNWAGSAAWAQGVAPGQAVERGSSGQVNWTEGVVQATGLGAPPANMAPGQARAMAERAAYTVAVRNLLEMVKGVRVDSATLVENYIVKNDIIRTQVSGFVRGAQIIKKDVQPDGGVEVTVQVPLFGGGESLLSAFLAEKGITSKELPPESPTDEGTTGLVIDARGLGVKPAVFPAVVDDKGVAVYGPETVDKAAAEKAGLVEYRTLPKGANISSLFGDDVYVIRPVNIPPPPREGRRPLKIKGMDKAGSLKANVMISSEDAQKIRGDGQMKGALGRSKVVIVTDPLIGGMEGRAPGMPAGSEQLLAAAGSHPIR